MSTDAWGITNGYEDAEEVWHDTPPETAPRSCLPWELPTPRRCLLDENAVRVVPLGVETPWHAPGELTLEDGTRLKISRKLPRDLPLGYHDFQPADERHGRARDRRSRPLPAART